MKLGLSPSVPPEIARRIESKVPVLAALKSSEWADIPLALRDRAQFSAQVTNARVMRTIQDRLEQVATGVREQLADGAEAVIDRRNFTSELRKIAIEEGLTPTDPAAIGTLRDITSIPRLNLIWDTQTKQAEGFARRKADLDPAALDEFPAQELVRFGAPKEPRDWDARWDEAGGPRVDGSRMVALKTDPIWSAISRFGTPYPPFDFNSTMGLVDLDREEAEALGLLARDQVVPGQQDPNDFNDDLESSLREITEADPETRRAWEGHLQDTFGDQIAIDGSRIRWRGAANDRAAELPIANRQSSIGGQRS